MSDKENELKNAIKEAQKSLELYAFEMYKGDEKSNEAAEKIKEITDWLTRRGWLTFFGYFFSPDGPSCTVYIFHPEEMDELFKKLMRESRSPYN